MNIWLFVGIGGVCLSFIIGTIVVAGIRFRLAERRRLADEEQPPTKTWPAIDPARIETLVELLKKSVDDSYDEIEFSSKIYWRSQWDAAQKELISAGPAVVPCIVRAMVTAAEGNDNYASNSVPYHKLSQVLLRIGPDAAYELRKAERSLRNSPVPGFGTAESNVKHEIGKMLREWKKRTTSSNRSEITERSTDGHF